MFIAKIPQNFQMASKYVNFFRKLFLQIEFKINYATNPEILIEFFNLPTKK